MKFGRVYLPGVWDHGMGKNSSLQRVCLVPNVHGVGGMVSFRDRLAKGLVAKGIVVTYNLEDKPYEAILVIGGTRDLAGLWWAKRHGVRIIQRLDGMNWIHRQQHTGWRHFLRAEYGNFILSFIRKHLADQVIYQSEFAHRWWDRVYKSTKQPWLVVYNGVDLECFTPGSSQATPSDRIRILLVEGTIGGGYEFGLQTAVQVAEKLHDVYSHEVEVMVVGRISATLQKTWEGREGVSMNYTGELAGDRIPGVDRSAHVLYAADLNPACPNAVIEALACGLPVAGFETGALPEIVTEGSGVLVPYGGDPWKLEPPDIDSLAEAINQIILHQAEIKIAARMRAERAFGLERMVEGYLKALTL